MLSKKILIILFLVFFNELSSAQENKLIDRSSSLVQKYQISETDDGWIYFKESVSIKQVVEDIFLHKESFGLETVDELRTTSGNELRSYIRNKTKWGNGGVLKVNQLHNGLRVEATQISLHFNDNGTLRLMHGKLAKNLSAPAPSLSESAALKIALNIVNAKLYAWEDEKWERQLKDDLKDQSASFFPKGELMYARIRPINDYRSSNFKLVYRFEIKSLLPENIQEELFIDAQSGQLIRRQKTMKDAWGTVNTLYNGVRGFTTQWRGFPNSDYVLKDQSSGDKLHTLRWSATTPWYLRAEIDDNDNVWDEIAASTHWAVQVAWEYYWTAFTRNGMDNAGGKIRIEAESDILNARYYRTGGYDYLLIGRTNIFAANGNLAAVDVVGHEFTHGITDKESGLLYQGESGALNESFSDIFGIMVERHIDGAVTWELGEDTGIALRSAQNPNQFTDPDTFSGLFWQDPNVIPTQENDWAGVHTNSGVQNHWFFLLSNGGNGVNDLGQNFNVQGIGEVDASRIAYRNLIFYMQPNSTFADARVGAINAARDLFGDCSQQLISTMNAWRAVGVGDAAPIICTTSIIPGIEIVCLENPYQRVFNITVFPQGASVTWQVPSHWGISTYNNGRTMTVDNFAFSPGIYTISATASFGGQTQMQFSNVEVRYCNEGCPDPNVPCESLTAVVEKAEDDAELKVFPNPTNSFAYVMIRRKESILTVIDSFGRTVLKSNIDESETILDTSTLNSGTYLVTVSNVYGRWTEKLVIIH